MAKSKAAVARFYMKHHMMESWQNQYSADGWWGCEFRYVFAGFYKHYKFAWKFDEQGNVKDHGNDLEMGLYDLVFSPQ